MSDGAPTTKRLRQMERNEAIPLAELASAAAQPTEITMQRHQLAAAAQEDSRDEYNRSTDHMQALLKFVMIAVSNKANASLAQAEIAVARSANPAELKVRKE